MKTRTFLLGALFLTASLIQSRAQDSSNTKPPEIQKTTVHHIPPMFLQAPWKAKIEEELPLLGHRNWIVIADSAYPLQTSPGIETISTGASQTEVVQAVLEALGKTPHVRPIIYTDAELKYVPESEAKGVTDYREQLAQILGKRDVQVLPHEQIIAKLDDAGKTFHVLLLKTTLTIPYTSVFMQLDCAYWSADAEGRLREAMKAVKAAH